MKLINNFLIAGGVVLALASCSKENLDKNPYNTIALGQSFQTVKDAKAWNNGLYSNLRSNTGSINQFSTEVQSDLVNASIEFGNRNGGPHRWDFTADDYTLSGVWAGYYYALTNVNIQIAGFNEITPDGTAETEELNRYKGDAYMARAYYYSELIQFYGKSYDPATASSDPGVPLVLDYDVNAQPARASVKAVYDQILADLAQAKTLLAGVSGSQGSTRFTIDAVNALEARVRLNMQDWTGAKAAADAVIATGKYPLINSQAALKAYWHDDTKTESIMQLFVKAPNELAPNVGSVYLGFSAGFNAFIPDFIPSQWVVDEYEATDIRKPVYFEQKRVYFQNAYTQNIWLVNKYPGNPALFTGANTNYAHAPKLFRIAEMYLISAEAGARSASATDDIDALAKLNALRTARSATVAAGLTGTALFEAVKVERLRELAFEGFRLWDLRRWNMPMTRRVPQNTALLTPGPNYYTLSKPANDPKYVWGIPTNDETINPNIQQNPGW